MSQGKNVIHVSILNNSRQKSRVRPAISDKQSSVSLSLSSLKPPSNLKQSWSVPESLMFFPLLRDSKRKKDQKIQTRRLPAWGISIGIICFALVLVMLGALLYTILTLTESKATTISTTDSQTTINATNASTVATINSSTTTTVDISTTTSTSTNATTTTDANTTTSTTTVTGGIPRFNASGNTIAGTPGPQAITPSLFNFPFGIALDSTETSIYIADQYNNRVQKWLIGEPNGTTIAGQTNAATGSGATFLNCPTDILVDSSNNLYVSDYNKNRVQLWYYGTNSGVTVAGNGTLGNANNQLNGPMGLALDSSTGTLYIADANNHRIMRYLTNATSGTVVAGGNGGGINRIQLLNPRGIYFESSSNSLLIANYAAHNVVRWVLGASNWTLIAGGTNGLSGSSASLLNWPYDVTVDPMGNIYIADTYNNRIQVFLPGATNGTTIIGTTGVSGSSATQLFQPFALLLDSQLNLYVSDTYNQRVQKFIHY